MARGEINVQQYQRRLLPVNTARAAGASSSSPLAPSSHLRPVSSHTRRGSRADMHLHRHVWSHRASAEALRIVRSVIYNSQKPLTSHDVYRLALQVPSKVTAKNPTKHTKNSAQVIEQKGPLPPNVDHPIRSMRYLCIRA